MPLAAVMILSVIATACNSGQVDNRFSSRSGLSSAASYGTKIGTYADDDSSTTIAELFVDPADLSEGQSFALRGSYHTDPKELATELGIAAGNPISPLSTATMVTATRPDAITKPITVVIGLPRRSAGLLSLFLSAPNYFIVHTTYDPVANRWLRGVVPLKDLKIHDDRVVLQTTRTGRYEVWHSAKPLSNYPSDAEIPPPDLVNAPITITSIVPLVAHTGTKVTVSGKYFSKRTILTVGGHQVRAIKLNGPNELSFIMPSLPFGFAVVTARGGHRLSRQRMITMADKKDYPLITLPAEKVCSTTVFYTIEGAARAGLKACGPKTCSAGGEQGCLASAKFPSVKQAAIEAGKLLSTVTINGVTGTIPPPKALPAPCSATVATDCLSSAKFPAVTGSLMTASHFRKGLAFPSLGITGSFPDRSKPLPGASAVFHLDSRNFSSALRDTTGIPYQFWDAYGNRHTLSGDGELKAANLREGRSVYGVKGQAKEGALPACAFTGDGNCRAHRYDYWAMSKATLKPENIRTGVRIHNVTGAYPSAQFPLGPKSGTPLTARNFEQMLASPSPFVYYDSQGTRHMATGSAEFKAANIKENVAIFGKVGTLKAFAQHTLKPEQIRYGVKIGKVTGTMKVNCRNLGPSVHDTIVDASKPTANPWGSDEHVCAGDGWQFVESTGANRCGSDRNTIHCMFKHKRTGYLWGGNSGRWEAPADRVGDFCEGRSRLGAVGGLSGWSPAPIEKLMEAYIHGLGYHMNGSFYYDSDSKGFLWSTTPSIPGLTLAINPWTGIISSLTRKKPGQTICYLK